MSTKYITERAVYEYISPTLPNLDFTPREILVNMCLLLDISLEIQNGWILHAHIMSRWSQIGKEELGNETGKSINSRPAAMASWQSWCV